jgi:hypothetical protein
MLKKPLISHTWARNSRLWHALPDTNSDALCGRKVTEPRMTLDVITPEDDVRCAKCDRLLWAGKTKSGK